MQEHSSTSRTQQTAVPGKKWLSHPLKALRRWDFRLLWIGQIISSMGSTLQAVALSWMVVSKHGSAVNLALTLLMLAIPQAALTLFGGVLVDRFDARSIMILADGLRAVTASALALVAENAVAPLWLVWALLLVHGTGNALFAPTTSSLAPRLVKAEDVESANALLGIMIQIGPLLGFLPAGLLLSTGGPALAFGLNAISYMIAVVMALLMCPLPRTPQKQSRPMWNEIREAVCYLRTVPWLLAMLLMDCFVAFAGITTNSIGAPMLAESLHAGVWGYSVLAWSYSCGATLGLLLPALYPIRSRRGMLCIFCKGAEAILIAMIAFLPLPFAALCMMSWSVLNGMLVVVTLSLIQQQTPSHMLGRVIAFSTLASTGMLPIAQITGGIIATAIGFRSLFVLAGCLVLVSGIIGVSVPALRQLN